VRRMGQGASWSLDAWIASRLTTTALSVYNVHRDYVVKYPATSR
jgi:hypothetical protein